MELVQIATVETQGAVSSVPVFNIHRSKSGKHFVQSRATECEVCYSDFTLLASKRQRSMFSLVRCPLDYSLDWPTHLISKDLNMVIKSLDEANHVDVILRAKWDPGWTRDSPKFPPLKMEFSPEVNREEILGVLLHSGSFHLYKREKRSWIKCCDIGSEHVRLVDDKICKNWQQMETVMGFAEIVSFDWLESEADIFRLLWLTKNGSLYVGNFDSSKNTLKIEKQETTLEETCQLKTVSFSPKKQLLATISNSGTISLNTVKSVSPLKLTNPTEIWTEPDNIPVAHLSIEEMKDNYLRIFMVKGFFLIILTLNAKQKIQSTIIERLPGPIISALHVINQEELMIGLVNQKIFFGSVKKDKVLLTEVHFSFDPKYSCTGILSFANSGLWIVAVQASKPHDKYLLKCPQKMLFCSLSKTDPFHEVINDPKRKVSRHFEYFEMVRFTKQKPSVEINTLQELIDKESGYNEAVRYFLKVQWFLMSIKLDPEAVKRVSFLKDLILAFEFHESLKKILKLNDELDEKQLLANYNLRNILLKIVNEKEQFGYSLLVEKMKKTFSPTIEKSLVLSKDPVQELCLICDEPVVPGKETCVQIHRPNRCCYTLLQIPLLISAMCSVCGLQSVEDVNQILGESVSKRVCPICDVVIE